MSTSGNKDDTYSWVPWEDCESLVKSQNPEVYHTQCSDFCSRYGANIQLEPSQSCVFSRKRTAQSSRSYTPPSANSADDQTSDSKRWNYYLDRMKEEVERLIKTDEIRDKKRLKESRSADDPMAQIRTPAHGSGERSFAQAAAKKPGKTFKQHEEFRRNQPSVAQ